MGKPSCNDPHKNVSTQRLLTRGGISTCRDVSSLQEGAVKRLARPTSAGNTGCSGQNIACAFGAAMCLSVCV